MSDDKKKFDPQEYIRQNPHPTEADIDMWNKATNHMIEHEGWRAPRPDEKKEKKK